MATSRILLPLACATTLLLCTRPTRGQDLAAAAAPPQPVPDAAALVQAETVVRETFAADYAKKAPGDRLDFARKLLANAADTADSPAGRFVRLREARDLAAGAGDVGVALQSIRGLAKAFEVDAAGMRVEAIAAAARAAAPAQTPAVAEAALAEAARCAARNDTATVDRLAAVAEAAAAASKEKDLAADRVRARLESIRGHRGRADRLRALRAALDDRPDDPDLNAEAGQVLCFSIGDWDDGLPLLAKGSDVRLADLARRDLGAAHAPAITRVALGHDWWDAAAGRQGVAKILCQERAAYWYRTALGDFDGARRAHLDARVQQAKAEADAFYAAEKLARPADPATAAAERTALDAAATTPLNAEALNADRTIGPAPGGKPYLLAGPVGVVEGANVTLTIAAGTEIRGGAFFMGRSGHIVVNGTRDKPVVFRGVTFEHDLGGSATATWAVFENCNFNKQCCWYEYHSSKWRFTDCVLFNCRFGGLTGVDYGVQIRRCALVSMDLPEIAHGADGGPGFDHMTRLRSEWNTIENCDFVDCTVPPTVAWCAERSNFLGCRFAPGEAYESDRDLEAVFFASDTVGPAPQAAWDRNPPKRARVKFVPSEQCFDSTDFAGRSPVPELQFVSGAVRVVRPHLANAP